MKSKNKKNKTFLLTGISGQVGSVYADYLLENTEVSVVGMMRWQEPLDNIRHLTNRINNNDRISLYNADLNDLASMQRMIKEIKPEFISHLAAQSFPKTSFDSPIETLQTNIIGTANLLEAIREEMDRDKTYNPTVHIVSSSEVYGKASSNVNGKEVLIGEETPFHGASPYAISKIGTDFLSRYYAEAYNMNTVVTRMGTHTGARRSPVFVESVMARKLVEIELGLHKPEILMGNLESIRTFQNTKDAVRAYWMLINKVQDSEIEKGEYFNIAGTEKFKLTEVLELMKSKINYEGDITVGIDPKRLRPIDADYQLFTCEKFNKAVPEWKPEISMEETFVELLDYWRNEYKEKRVPLDS